MTIYLTLLNIAIEKENIEIVEALLTNEKIDVNAPSIILQLKNSMTFQNEYILIQFLNYVIF